MPDGPSPFLVATVRARRLAGRRVVRRAVVVVAAVVSCLVIASQVQASAAARRRWGDTRVVAVARHDLKPGEVVSAGAVDLRRLPAVAVAADALAEAPVGSVVRYPVGADEPLLPSRLAPEGLTGVAALVPAGERAVALPVGPAARPPLRIGDRVDVLAVVIDGMGPGPPEPSVEGTGDPTAAEGDPAEGDPAEGDPTAAETEPAEGDPNAEPPATSTGAYEPTEMEVVVPLVERALVVDVGEEAVTVAVPGASAAAVAHAVTQGAVVLTLTGE